MLKPENAAEACQPTSILNQASVVFYADESEANSQLMNSKSTEMFDEKSQKPQMSFITAASSKCRPEAGSQLTEDVPRSADSRVSLAELQLAVLHSEDGEAADMMDVSVAEDVGKNALC